MHVHPSERERDVMRIGVMTSGGDAPGLNTAIRAAVLRGARDYGDTFVGIVDGWRGLRDGARIDLDWRAVRGISKTGGTILGTSRVDPRTEPGGVEAVRQHLRRSGLDALIVIGGESSLSIAHELALGGAPVVGVPTAIDNDMQATDYTFGFDTAVEVATEAIDRLGTTGEAHHRCMIAEVMGRRAGWIALHAGLASAAHAILIPEQPEPLERIAEWMRAPFDRGRSPLIVVAEGFRLADPPGPDRADETDPRPRMGGIGEALAPLIEAHTGIETRATTLGHIQRGGVPSAADRVWATRLGVAAVDAVHDGELGCMVAIRSTSVERVPLAQAIGSVKTVPEARYREARTFFG